MDLSFSPDFDALICYGIVLLLGAVVAFGQVKARLEKIERVWLIRRTYWLFAIYAAVPVVLFWFLDRTGAISDTSFFAAVLVGFGYQGIMTGSGQLVRSPGDVSQFWTPFVAYADRTAKLVQDHDARRRRRLAEQIIASIGDDAVKIAKLEELARKTAPDLTVLEGQLKAIADAKAKRGEAATTEEKVRTLYNTVLTATDPYEALRDKGVIDKSFYWFNVREAASMMVVVFVALVVIFATVAGYRKFERDIEAKWPAYYAWRLAKTNSTAIDLFRARQRLGQLLHDDNLRSVTAERLAQMIQEPGMPMERVDLAIAILLENRADKDRQTGQIETLLVKTLRAKSVDARMRVNEALKLLADSCHEPAAATPPAWKPADWKPSDGDSIAALERQIGQWSAYWAANCGAK